MSERKAQIKRATKETQIQLTLNVDGTGKSKISTRIPFFDHMLTLFSKHAVMDLDLKCKGDLEVDAHHTVEDCGIALGQAFLKALGDKTGLRRYGTGFNDSKNAAHPSTFNLQPSTRLKGEAYVPMDECLARCVIDFSGRPYLVWRGLDKLDFKHISAREKYQVMS
jgi:imidazoleglycerol-phosphate dehydratase